MTYPSKAGIPGGIDLTAWTEFTPVATTAFGTVTAWGASSGRYQLVGKAVHFEAVLRIATNGSGAGYVLMTLPVTPRTGWRGGLTGWRGDTSSLLSGFVYGEAGTKVLAIFGTNSTYPGADGAELWANGVYEAA